MTVFTSASIINQNVIQLKTIFVSIGCIDFFAYCSKFVIMFYNLHVNQEAVVKEKLSLVNDHGYVKKRKQWRNASEVSSV